MSIASVAKTHYILSCILKHSNITWSNARRNWLSFDISSGLVSSRVSILIMSSFVPFLHRECVCLLRSKTFWYTHREWVIWSMLAISFLIPVHPMKKNLVQRPGVCIVSRRIPWAVSLPWYASILSFFWLFTRAVMVDGILPRSWNLMVPKNCVCIGSQYLIYWLILPCFSIHSLSLSTPSVKTWTLSLLQHMYRWTVVSLSPQFWRITPHLGFPG